jgi:hypothetical protein
MQVIHLAGLPFETADSEELNYRKAVRDVMLRGLSSSRFAVYHHIVRRQVDASTQGAFADRFQRRSRRHLERASRRTQALRQRPVPDDRPPAAAGPGRRHRRLPARPEGDRQGRSRRHAGRRPPRTGQRHGTA